jgi:peptide/nickel transport system substrate-binding protein
LGAPSDLTRRELIRGLTLGGAIAFTTPISTILEACGDAGGSAPRSNGTVSFALSVEPRVLNPPIHTLLNEAIVMSLMFPGLVRMRADGIMEPDLAESYRVEDSGMTYRFKLRPGLQWQDGRPLTARDFLFTYQTYVDPRTKTAYLLGWDKIDRVETPDETTVVYRMKEVFAPFLYAVGGNPVLPQHVLADTADIRRDAFNRSPVGCGPFKLVDWKTASQIVLEANPKYWRGRPRLDRFIFKIVPDAVTQINQLEAGEVDIVSVADPVQWDRIRGLKRQVATVAYDDTRYVLVQLDEYEFLKDVRVRQALDYATPKQDIVRGVLRGLATPAYADVPPGSPYYQPKVERHEYSLDRARSLLTQAGFAIQNGVATREGRPLELPIYTVSTVPTYVQVAQVLEDSWSKIGVRTSVTTMDAATLFGNRGPQWDGKDAALVFSWSQGVDPYNYVSWSSDQIPNNEDDPGANGQRYSNRILDPLLVKGAKIAELSQRKVVYDQIQQILAHDVPVIFLYWPKSLYAYSARIQGFRPNAFAGAMNAVWEWTKS